MRSGQCIFCGPTTAKITNEHLVPDWVSGLFHKNPKGNQYLVEAVTATQSDADRTIYSSPSLNRKARVVCRDCNHGWMSALENDHAKPLLTPLILGFHGRAFTHEQLAVVLSWVMKCALVFEHGMPVSERFYTQDERATFMRERLPMADVHIWLAEFRGSTKNIRGFQTIHTLHYELPNLETCRGQATTIAIGNFAFQVLAGRWPERTRPIGPKAWHNATVPIWPFHSCPVRWPPREYITPDTLDSFCYRFSRSTPEGLRMPRIG